MTDTAAIVRADHCRRAARTGCGCRACRDWRAALVAFRTGQPTQGVLL